MENLLYKNEDERNIENRLSRLVLKKKDWKEFNRVPSNTLVNGRFPSVNPHSNSNLSNYLDGIPCFSKYQHDEFVQ